jgi:hypothetical protein
MEMQVKKKVLSVKHQWLQIDIRADIEPEAQMVAAWYESITVAATVDVTPEGEVMIRHMTIYAPMRDEGHGVTRTALREVAAQLDAVLAEAMRQAGVIDEGDTAERAFLRRRGDQDPVVRRESTSDHLGRVAAIYQSAEDKSSSGLRAVMAAFPGRGKTGRASKTTAARWIGQAREAGLLPSKERQND